MLAAEFIVSVFDVFFPLFSDRSTEWMRTAPEFKVNPIGVFFDPEQVYRAHKAGASFALAQQQIDALNARNLEPEAIASVRVRRLDGAKTWKFLD